VTTGTGVRAADGTGVGGGADLGAADGTGVGGGVDVGGGVEGRAVGSGIAFDVGAGPAVPSGDAVVLTSVAIEDDG
jgi:hypothetical protein